MSDYPIPVFHFQVEWAGSNIGFTEVSGLTIETQMIEYRDGSDKTYATRKFPGIPKYTNITLKRGVIPTDHEFYQWLNTTSLNKVKSRDIIISLLNETHEAVMSWRAEKAWPVKIEGPSLKSTGNEAAIETIELAHEGLSLIE